MVFAAQLHLLVDQFREMKQKVEPIAQILGSRLAEEISVWTPRRTEKATTDVAIGRFKLARKNAW